LTALGDEKLTHAEDILSVRMNINIAQSTITEQTLLEGAERSIVIKGSCHYKCFLRDRATIFVVFFDDTHYSQSHSTLNTNAGGWKLQTKVGLLLTDNLCLIFRIQRRGVIERVCCVFNDAVISEITT
jgi:hypothetical protein